MESEARDTRPFAAPSQTKPWGHEVVFATVPGRYAGKVLHVHAGRSLSCQYHRQKDETILLLEGSAVVEYGDAADAMESVPFGPGDTIHLPAGVVHRIEAVTDAVLVECSTAGPGWAQDVVRLSDAYGREGTSEP